MIGDYVFTEHLLIRMKERFPHLNMSWNDRWTLYKELDYMIQNSYDERRYLNDTAYMFHLYETYGYDSRYEFLVNLKNNIVFVVSLNHGKKKIIKTCLPMNTNRKFIPIQKFSGRKREKTIVPSSSKHKKAAFNEMDAREEYLLQYGSDDKSNLDDVLK